MTIKLLIVNSLLILFLVMHINCISRGQVNLSGRLIYVNGSRYIKLFYSETLKDEIFYEGNNGVSIEYITKMSNDKFLFADCDGLRSPNCLLKEFDVNSKIVKILRSGRMPTYIVESKKVFFYNSPNDDGENWLLVSDIDQMNIAKKVAKAPTPIILQNGLSMPIINPPVQIASNEIVFVGEDKTLWVYNISESKAFSIGINHCIPQVWRSQANKLICYDWKSKYYYQINLENKNIEKLSQLKQTYGLVYIPNHDILVYGKTKWRFPIGEAYEIFAYNFSDDKRTKLHSNSSISSGIWFNE